MLIVAYYNGVIFISKDFLLSRRIVDMDGRRIDKVRVKQIQDQTEMP